MKDTIKSAISSGHGTALLYAGALGLVISDIIPTPADALYFNIQRNLKDKLARKLITPAQYWTREAVAYYGLNPLWWALVLGTMVAIRGNYTHKAKVGIALIGAGAVIGILHRNIQRDVSEGY